MRDRGDLPIRGEQVYEGKAKRVFRTPWPDRYLLHFTDEATAFDGRKRAAIPGKGRANNLISARLMEVVEQAGVPTHLLDVVGPRDQLVRALAMLPLEVVVRRAVAGSLARRLGLQEGRPIEPPLVELYYKRDDLGDPLVTEDHVRLLGVASPEELAEMRRLALRVGETLAAYLADRGLRLVDFKLEFGRAGMGELVLADEISPDTCRLWDLRTGEPLDKDRFRRDLGGEAEAYQEVLRRVVGEALAAPRRGDG